MQSARDGLGGACVLAHDISLLSMSNKSPKLSTLDRAPYSATAVSIVPGTTQPTHSGLFFMHHTPRSKFRKYNPAIISLHATTPIRYSPVEPHRLVWYAVASRCPLDRSPWSGKRPPPSRAALLCSDATNIEVTHSIQQLSIRVLNCLPYSKMATRSQPSNKAENTTKRRRPPHRFVGCTLFASRRLPCRVAPC